jgi:hypothetical protein
MEARTNRTGAGRESGRMIRSAAFAYPRRVFAGWALLAAAALVVSAGCQNSKKDAGIARLAPRSVPYLNGVPVPSGFRVSERLTDAYESGGVRFARQEYVGSSDPAAIREFYKEQMPLLGWNEISSHDIKGRLSMRFETKSEECNLTIEPDGWFSRSRIQVVVKPFNRSVSQPPAKRPMP